MDFHFMFKLRRFKIQLNLLLYAHGYLPQVFELSSRIYVMINLGATLKMCHILCNLL